jgi:hypothetical protein
LENELLFYFYLASSSFSFDGQTIAYYDATFIPLHNRQDEFRLRFKTNYPNGLLFYAKGTQNNDYLTVELRNGSIFVGIDLGRIFIFFSEKENYKKIVYRFNTGTSRCNYYSSWKCTG